MATAIERADAITLVQEQAVTDQPPTLDALEVGRLVDRSARMDTAGNAVDSNDWTETYDLNAATALAWERKAALTATKFDATIDGQSVSRSQLHAHCIGMARMYRARIGATVRKAQPENVPLSHLEAETGY